MTTTRAWAHGTGGPPDRKGPGRRSPGRTRFAGVLLVLVSLLSLAACYLVFSWWLPSDRERYQDYRAAEPCWAHALEQGRTDCLSTWQLTVEKTVDEYRGKTHVYEATLTMRTSWRGTVSFGSGGPLLERLAPGDQVTATAWRGDIMALSRNGVRQNTSEVPRDELQVNAAVGVVAALVAAQTFLSGAVRLARPREVGPSTWIPYSNPLLVLHALVCLGVGVAGAWIGIPWWTVPAIAVPVAVCTAALRLRGRRGRW